jgi:hypothetical protein
MKPNDMCEFSSERLTVHAVAPRVFPFGFLGSLAQPHFRIIAAVWGATNEFTPSRRSHTVCDLWGADFAAARQSILMSRS